MSAADLRARAPLRFSKMHGAGNDFVILDLRDDAAMPEADAVRRIADRHRGVGCDQLIAIVKPTTPASLAGYRIWNTDGSPAQQCGNGARCVAAWLRRDGAGAAARFILDSPAGAIEVRMHADDDVELAMGVPEFAPARIPLASSPQQPAYEMELAGETIHFGAVSMGNPHALVEVEDLASAPVARIGTALQASALFADGVNVGFAQVRARDRIGLRVVERGVGETLACGSGACAAVAILVRQGRVGRDVAVALPGGTLRIHWPHDDAPIYLRGPAVFVFEGEWHP